jgi:hypothetical protein
MVFFETGLAEKGRHPKRGGRPSMKDAALWISSLLCRISERIEQMAIQKSDNGVGWIPRQQQPKVVEMFDAFY